MKPRSIYQNVSSTENKLQKNLAIWNPGVKHKKTSNQAFDPNWRGINEEYHFRHFL